MRFCKIDDFGSFLSQTDSIKIMRRPFWTLFLLFDFGSFFLAATSTPFLTTSQQTASERPEGRFF
jgi:hypothetical protein